MPIAVLAVTLLAASVVGLLWRRHNGRMRAVAPNTALRPGIDFDSVGATPGTRATLVQFSSSFCAPCRSTRQILSDVAELVDGVTYVEIDAESHLELVREHQILRTPTTLVLDADGAVVVRASGQPRKADVIAALGRALDRSTTTSPTP